MGENKRAQITPLVLIVGLVLVFLVWAITYNTHECRSDSHCGSGEYCGSDFACHQIPVIEREVHASSNNLIIPAIILGIAIVIAAFVLKGNEISLRSRRKN